MNVSRDYRKERVEVNYNHIEAGMESDISHTRSPRKMVSGIEFDLMENRL